jgi:hypothetical protein
LRYLFYVAPYTLYYSSFPFFAAPWLRGKKLTIGVIEYRGSLFLLGVMYDLFNAAKSVFPSFLEGITRNFDFAIYAQTARVTGRRSLNPNIIIGFIN